MPRRREVKANEKYLQEFVLNNMLNCAPNLLDEESKKRAETLLEFLEDESKSLRDFSFDELDNIIQFLPKVNQHVQGMRA